MATSKNSNVISLLILLCASPITSDLGNPPSITAFINKLVETHFKYCEIIFVSVNLNSNTTVTVPILHYLSAGALRISINQKNSAANNITFDFDRMRDVHKLNHKQCALAIIYIHELDDKLPQNLFEVLTPRYLPIIRKDEDQFLFVCNNETEAKEILLYPKFGSKIKFKLAVVPEAKSLLYVDLYGDNGKELVKIKDVSEPEDLQFEILFPDTTFDFHGKEFRVANPKAPFYFEMAFKNGKNHPVRGLYKVWLDVMMHRFNFTIDLFQSSLSGGTGKQLANGTWLGAVADVLNGDADMAIYIGHIYNRHKFVEWSTPVTYEWMVFITHKPKTFFTPTAIFRPLTFNIWIGFFVSIAVTVLFLKLVFSAQLFFNNISAWKIFNYLIASFIEQDAENHIDDRLNTVRVTIAFWLIFSLIISTAYRGKLVSLIAFPASTWVPTTFDDLAHSQYRVGVNVLGKGGAAYSVLSTSKSPVYQNLFRRMEIYPDPTVCLKDGLTHDIGCIMWKSVADYTQYRNFTDVFGRSPFQPSQQTTSFIADGYIWEKRAIFRKHFDNLTWSIVESGLSTVWFYTDLEALKKKRMDWERKVKAESNQPSSRSAHAETPGPSKLKLIHFAGLFTLFAFGHVCALVCFLWEACRGLRIRRTLRQVWRNYV
ncbi:unnamed protein product [Orchesella dallaii]|uniref:Ionotropic glutamate receptor C-terminal domain-containing protein n=1 Tax=Orchesella dallaii TaxID=48710 RepID=A0ABP1PPU5_9HEXA